MEESSAASIDIPAILAETAMILDNTKQIMDTLEATLYSVVSASSHFVDGVQTSGYDLSTIQQELDVTKGMIENADRVLLDLQHAEDVDLGVVATVMSDLITIGVTFEQAIESVEYAKHAILTGQDVHDDAAGPA